MSKLTSKPIIGPVEFIDKVIRLDEKGFLAIPILGRRRLTVFLCCRYRKRQSRGGVVVIGDDFGLTPRGSVNLPRCAGPLADYVLLTFNPF
jgi:hypothetical protein